MKFTDKEIQMLEDMIDFPEAFKLTPEGIKTIKSIYNKITKTNKGNQ